MTTQTVWVVDDDRSIRWVLEKALSSANIPHTMFESADDARKALERSSPSVVMTDIRMPGEDGLSLLDHLHTVSPKLPVIVMTAHSDLDSAVASYSRGAFEYLPKPFDVDDAILLVRRALDRTGELPKSEIPSDRSTTPLLLGEAPAMQDVYRAIGRLSQAEITVLINGESGTGKELVAHAVHANSPRRNGPFIPLNMAAIPKDLMESELFGHEKGAFTGAVAARAGRFEQAHGGTLFLDEIGDMPMETQTRLLRVLQEGEYTTIGGRQPIKTDVRVIAATHQDLRRLIRQGLFREDLYFRLNVVPMRLPPLRERLEDIEELVRHFMARGADEGLSVKSFDREAIDALKGHGWPGNVRELENLVRRLSALHADEVIGAEAVRLELSDNDMAAPQTQQAGNNLTESLHFHLSNYFKGHGSSLPPNGLYERVMREVETPLIELCLEATRGNQIKAADLLGVNRNTLRKKIRDLNIEVVRSPKK